VQARFFSRAIPATPRQATTVPTIAVAQASRYSRRNHRRRSQLMRSIREFFQRDCLRAGAGGSRHESRSGISRSEICRPFFDRHRHGRRPLLHPRFAQAVGLQATLGRLSHPGHGSLLLGSLLALNMKVNVGEHHLHGCDGGRGSKHFTSAGFVAGTGET